MKNPLLIFLTLAIVACKNKRKSCNTDEMQNNYESFTVCSDYNGDLYMENRMTTKININSDIGEYLEVIKGDYMVLEYVNHSHAINVTDYTGSIELALIIGRKEKISGGDIIKVPSRNIKGIGVSRGAWIGSNQFNDIKGNIRIIEAQENSIQIEIIDSLYSINGVSPEEWNGQYKKGMNHPYSITGKITFNK